LLACYQSNSKHQAARLRTLENLGEAKQKTRLPACLFVGFGVAFGNQKVHRSKAYRMSVVLTNNCIGHRKAGGYQAVEFQSSRRICGAAEFGC
jgi:hypothetical protein